MQAVDLRMHLRQCMACRAAVRGLHDASRPLAVVFPATGLAVASGGVEPTHSFFVRVYETLSMHAECRHLQWPRRGRLKWPHLASVVVCG